MMLLVCFGPEAKEWAVGLAGAAGLVWYAVWVTALEEGRVQSDRCITTPVGRTPAADVAPAVRAPSTSTRQQLLAPSPISPAPPSSPTPANTDADEVRAASRFV
eukprot:1189191-Prorocentrum_minimum.AAC.6